MIPTENRPARLIIVITEALASVSATDYLSSSVIPTQKTPNRALNRLHRFSKTIKEFVHMMLPWRALQSLWRAEI